MLIRLKRVIGDAGGSQIAEAALVLPIMFMLLLGIYWFGRALNTYETINHAAIEAARAAATHTCATCSPSNVPLTADQVASVVQQALQASSLNPALVTHSAASLQACTGGTITCQALSGPTSVCLAAPIQLSPLTGAEACGVYVSFQYPYQFYLPFTSLNLQQIQLNASVQMRGEY
jgi:Flp pilus assembly protein TadG